MSLSPADDDDDNTDDDDEDDDGGDNSGDDDHVVVSQFLYDSSDTLLFKGQKEGDGQRLVVSG